MKQGCIGLLHGEYLSESLFIFDNYPLNIYPGPGAMQSTGADVPRDRMGTPRPSQACEWEDLEMQL